MSLPHAVERCAECLRVIDHAPPLSPEEKREFQRLIAREMERAESRRRSYTQPGLNLA